MSDFLFKLGHRAGGSWRPATLVTLYRGEVDRLERVGEGVWIDDEILAALHGGTKVTDSLPSEIVETGVTCRSPNQHPNRGEGKDGWRRIGPDRVCTYCGSIHPEDMVAIMGDVNAEISIATGKTHKVYVRRPWIVNAGMGGLKFYTWHGDDRLIGRINIEFGGSS